MAMGIPVITNSGVGDVAGIVKKYNAGFVLEGFSDDEFKVVVNGIAAGEIFKRDDIRNGAKEFYALNNAIELYRKVYQQVFNESNQQINSSSTR
jgi:hypothetical protein